jgi:small subunit ribosomal protein S9
MPVQEATVSATGRRKTAVARVNLKPGKGKIEVNGREFEDYFTTTSAKIKALAPLETSESRNKFDISIRARGGGILGQAGAVSHALARALVAYDSNQRTLLKKNGYLTRDSRQKERKKSGQPGARKRFQFSKR